MFRDTQINTSASSLKVPVYRRCDQRKEHCMREEDCLVKAAQNFYCTWICIVKPTINDFLQSQSTLMTFEKSSCYFVRWDLSIEDDPSVTMVITNMMLYIDLVLIKEIYQHQKQWKVLSNFFGFIDHAVSDMVSKVITKETHPELSY